MSIGYDYIKGITDDPVELITDDNLSMKKQIDGFSQYIYTCQTPLTISIQGSWGSGKTSFFRMVRDKIENSSNPQKPNNCIFLEFNAWQYSQFNKDSDLPISLLTYLTSQIEEEIKSKNAGTIFDAEKKEKLIDTLKTVTSFIGGIGNRYIEKRFGFNILSEKKKLKEDSEEFIKLMNGVNAIAKLQKDFREYVEKALEKRFEEADDATRVKSRIVVFIDDLDRLLPEKAVELLDTIKIFLDCPRCVFVLAIDYDVVIKGVEKKYNHEISREKANDYFEKMIQVVYRLPEKMASMNRYICSLLRKIDSNISITNEFSRLISAAGKDTPRNVKRLINNFHLIKSIDSPNFKNITPEKIGFEKASYDVFLFAVMLLREVCYDNYIELYFAINSNIKNVVSDMFEKYYISKPDNNPDLQAKFLRTFCHALDYYSHNFKKSRHISDYEVEFPISLREYIDDYLYLFDKLKTALKALNYSDDKMITVGMVKLTSNQFKICDVYQDGNPFWTDAGDGSVKDAYKATISLIAGLCTDEGVKKLCKELDFIEITNRGSGYEEIVYHKENVEGIPIYVDTEEFDINGYTRKWKKDHEGKLYVRTANNDDEYINRIRNLADKLEITVSWHADMEDAKGNTILGSKDRENDDKSFDEVKRLYEYIDFGFMLIALVGYSEDKVPLRKNGINYLYELRGKSYEDILKISNNDHKSVDKLVNTVTKYGIFIDKNTDESN